LEVLVIDNYDSFVFNLVHYIEGLGAEVIVKRNDEVTLEEVDLYTKILISPGPGLPKNAGIVPELLRQYAASKSILGVCLGHQAIAEAFGSKLKNLPEVHHGVSHPIQIKSKSKLFANLPKSFKVGRYHSWMVDKISEELIITAIDDEGEIMALKHKEYDVEGVQFHPESVLTEYGKDILANWLGVI